MLDHGSRVATTRVTAADPPVTAFRADIQGLRAVAVLLVVGYHAGVPLLPGGYVGVDVFFVISGFLITGLLVREAESTGRLSLRRFWARRVRRLLPAAAVTLAAVAVITAAVLPFTRWPSIAIDIAASATYVVNWRLAEGSVDYLTAEAAPSPVQHFWSLAVEEQFYLTWPLLIVLLMALCRIRQWRPRPVLLVAATAVAAGSLAWSASLTSSEPGRAYFASTTRAWELAAGAILAIAAPRVARIGRSVAEPLGWLGLVAVGWAAVSFDESTAFPGVAALVPVIGTGAVLVAGTAAGGHSAGKALGVPVMRDVGALSYSLYLWHWPVLVAATAVWGREDGTLWLPVAVMAAGFAVIPAWFTYRVVEEPIHRGRYFAVSPRRAAGLAAVCTATGVAAALAVAVPGDVAGDLAIDPVAASRDDADVYGDGCHQSHSGDELLSCVYGDQDADFVVALAGDSHAAQWQPALERIAAERGWRLETYTKSDCNFADVTFIRSGGAYESCATWNTRLRRQLTGADAPDVVVTSGSNGRRVLADGDPLDGRANEEAFADGLRRSWQAVRRTGAEVVVIRDTPYRDFDTPECVALHPAELDRCASSVTEGLARHGQAPDRVAAAESPDVEWVDMTRHICPAGECPGVIGDMIVWRDRHHLTSRFAESLAPALDTRLTRAIGG